MKPRDDMERFDQVVQRALERDRLLVRKILIEPCLVQIKEQEKNVQQNSPSFPDKPAIVDSKISE